MKKLKILILCGLWLLMIGGLTAQPSHRDLMAEALFAPELVMHNQQAIGLSEEQKAYIKAEIQKAATRFTDLNWQIQSEMETMAALVKSERVDETRAMTQLDKLLGIEREIKRTQLGLLFRIKNKLTAEQQAQLQSLKLKPGKND
ncbi:MAG: hypothetical protein HYR55_17440 [Acidobacteria bacterium]|nr:hypothetical protein [Acidobacteriota bacterium]MBI3657071.1 hypothetical protein [Acidobacteriota bacterium]